MGKMPEAQNFLIPPRNTILFRSVQNYIKNTRRFSDSRDNCLAINRDPPEKTHKEYLYTYLLIYLFNYYVFRGRKFHNLFSICHYHVIAMCRCHEVGEGP